VIDCCLMATQQFFSHMMARKKIIGPFDFHTTMLDCIVNKLNYFQLVTKSCYRFTK